MGSFRIVTGSGYGRHEITDARRLRREFDNLKRVAERNTTPTVRVKKRSTGNKNLKLKLYDKIWDEAVRKANKWARETAAEMRASVPVDTGNLRDSIHVLEDECYRNKASGEIVMVVGADLNPAGGRGRLYAPPMRKRSPRYGRKTPPWEGYRLMPVPPNEYASKFLELDGASLDKRFKAISQKNAKKIMGK